jgi:hypothetical protein
MIPVWAASSSTGVGLCAGSRVSNLSGRRPRPWGGTPPITAGGPLASQVFRRVARQAIRRLGRSFSPLPPALLALHQRLKAALDPRGILNPGRLYRDL